MSRVRRSAQLLRDCRTEPATQLFWSSFAWFDLASLGYVLAARAGA